MIKIPNKALKYILFQRTDFSIYTTLRWPLRIVMNKRIPIYNLAIKLEALLLPGRTKRLFSLDMEKEYQLMKSALPEKLETILDIGCGVAGIDIMFHKHYESRGINPHFYLLDKTEVNSKVYYGLEKTAAYYNSLDVAKKLLVVNGVEDSHINTQEATGVPIFPDTKFDLIVSLISWGFHYPVDTYLDEVYSILKSGGRLIIDIRRGSGGKEKIEAKFGSISMVNVGIKHDRFLAIKK
jgi:SAM-dependent methyltransferase